jgi:hypothetical protein
MAQAMVLRSICSLSIPEIVMKHHHAATSPAKTAAPKQTVQAAGKDEAAMASPAGESTASKDEFVRQVAYDYYEARGRIGGYELDDWLRAEAEFERILAAGKQAPAAANPTQ